MSSQNQDGVLFSIAHEQQHFRLVELPDELVELISNAPQKRLQIKSVEPSESSLDPAYVVLCSPDKTFQVRQIQTSNTVFLARPSTCATDSEISVPGITAISSVPTGLELTPSEPTSAVPFLLQLVPRWPGSQMLERGRQQSLQSSGQKPSQIFNSVPLSSAECAKAYDDLVVFSFDGVYYRPTAEQLYQACQEMLTAFIAEDIDMTYGSVLHASDIYRPLEEAGWPEELVKAIVARFGPGRIEQRTALEFVGSITLEAETAGGKSIPVDTFLERWKNVVPEKWRGDVSLDLLDDKHQIIAGNVLATSYRDQDLSGGQAGAANGLADASSKKRKWHEKFKASRKK